jgi:hypothetical protein
MHVIQRDGQRSLDTEIVYYGGTEELKVGYVVCYDPTASETPTEWKENQKGRTVAKPATANLEFFAGIVTVAPQKRMGEVSGSNKGYATIARVRRGDFLKARVKANAVTGTTVLQPVDGKWHLASDGTATSNLYSRRSVAIAAETVDSSADADASVRLVTICGVKG